MLWLTTTIVSMVAWADRRSGGRAVSSNTALPTARPVHQIAALLDRVNALVQRVRDMPGGVIPLRKVQRRVDPAGDLAQTTRGEQEGRSEERRVGKECRSRWA